ncbi:hypothetical protein C8T65DRAFT_838193 [Cerioporus squamosus]|nr:hypothetical protein C8T65DRAFT_838193 [Cerioporus squamosus]
MAPIRLTHVCRAWRTLIHHSPVFWTSILDPDKETVYTDRRKKFPIVLAAFEDSLSVAPLSFSLHGGFLPVLSTLSSRSHPSRISTLWLDCAPYGPGFYIRRFLDLRIPQIEKLTLWRDGCQSNRAPASVALDTSTVRFTRLSYLRTNCMQLALTWVTPAMRTLIFGSTRRGEEKSPSANAVASISSRGV